MNIFVIISQQDCSELNQKVAVVLTKVVFLFRGVVFVMHPLIDSVHLHSDKQ